MHRGTEMIKKLLAIFFGLLIVCRADAAVYLRVKNGSALKSVVEKHFTDVDDQKDVLEKYRDLLGDNGGMGLTADDLWTVCKAGGLKIKNDDGKQKCQAFVNDLTALTTVYYQVCDVDKGKSGITARCIDTVFDAATGDKQIEVTTRAAINLAKAHAKKAYNDTVECLDFARTKSNDDFIACKSTKSNNTYYEYRFSDAKESGDLKVQYGVEAGICAIYGLDYTRAGSSSTGSVSAGIVTSTVSWPSYCRTKDANLCKKINTTATSFGYSVKYNSSHGCVFESNVIRDAKDIKNDYGNPPINNWEFSNGVKSIELYAMGSLDDTIKKYVKAKIAPTQITNFSCEKSHKRYVRGGFEDSEDVLTCYVNGKRVDFVFDDLTQARTWIGNKKIAGSKQALDCLTADGVFDGKNCTAVGKDVCDKLRLSNDSNCPECKDIKWDAEHKMCVLGSAKNAANWGKAIKIGTVAGTAVIAVLATVFSGGTAAPGAWGIVMTVADVAVVTGATVQVTSEAVMTFGIFEPFVKKANLCIQNNDVACAEDVLINELNKMQSYSKEFTSREASALDEIFVKLIGMLPDDSRFWTDFFGNPDFFDCTVPSNPETCVVKENAQFWQVARTVGNVAMIAGGFLKMFATVGSQLSKTQNAVRARVVDNMRSKSPLAKVVNPGGSNGALVSNDFIKNTMKIPGVETNSALVRHLGLKPGDVFWLMDNGQVLRNVSMVRNLWGLVPVTVGTGNILYHSNDDADFFVVKGGYENTTPGTTGPESPVVPGEDSEESGTGPETNPGPETGPETKPELRLEPGDTSVETGPQNPERNIKPYAVEKPMNVGLIATAAVLGAVGSGALIGGLILNDKDDAKLVDLSGARTQLERDLETVLNNANGYFFVGDDTLKLLPMPTENNTSAKIVKVDNSVVVVVDWRGHNLPFYINVDTGSWAPLLGIGENGGWFNVYPTKGAPTVIVEIQNVLNQQLKPATVVQFVGANVLGLQFPNIAPAAYEIINAEFPNGVVETFNGVFTPADQILYNNNYQRILNLFNTAAHLGGFL